MELSKIKTKQDAKEYLLLMAEDLGLSSEYDTADYVLLHYHTFDHQGSDRLFLAYCEEILAEQD